MNDQYFVKIISVLVLIKISTNPVYKNINECVLVVDYSTWMCVKKQGCALHLNCNQIVNRDKQKRIS